MEGKGTAPYIDTPVFQGPLDLLLHLIQQNKLDIYDIQIALITDQYIESLKKSLKQMEDLDLEATSEFVVLASQLLYLKSRQLLPKPQKTEEEIRMEEALTQDLVNRLVAYKTFKNIAGYLGTRIESTGSSYFRHVDLEEIQTFLKPSNPLEGVSTIQLLEAFFFVLSRIEKGEDVQYVKVEEIPVDTMITDIIRRLILYPKGLRFSKLLRYQSKMEIVIAFIALLELLKDGKVRAEQDEMKKDIYIVPTPKTFEFLE